MPCSLCAGIGRCCLSPDCKQRVQQCRHVILCHGVHRNEGRQADIGAIRSHHGFQVGAKALRSPRNAVKIALNLEQWNEFDVHKQQQEHIALSGRDNSTFTVSEINLPLNCWAPCFGIHSGIFMPRSVKIFPLNKGGGAKRQGVSVRLSNPSRQPPEGFTTAVVSPSFPL